MSFWSFVFPYLNALDFTWVIVLIAKASNYVNLTPMVLDWFEANLVATFYWLCFSPFDLSHNLGLYQTWWSLIGPIVILDVMWINDLHHARKYYNGNVMAS
jgi:hypothetical protein